MSPSGAAAARPQAGQERPEASGSRPQAGQGRPEASGSRPQAGQERPEASGSRPQAGQGPVAGAPGQGVTVTVGEDQINQAIGKALAAAADSPITSLSVDLRPGVIGVSVSVLVEGQMIATQVGLAPVVESCALSLRVVEEPAQPSGIPAPLWDSVVGQVVAAIESAVVTPQSACVKSVEVSDGQMRVTVGR